MVSPITRVHSFLELVFLSCQHLYMSVAVQQDYEFDIGHLQRFSFRELQNATGNFNSKNILGQGGFGVVYKGILPNKTLIAVKRLKDPITTGERQFQTEVEMIGLALHRNLLRLYGFCMTSNERLLVYPYMPNGSVADCLRGMVSFFLTTFMQGYHFNFRISIIIFRSKSTKSVLGLAQA